MNTPTWIRGGQVRGSTTVIFPEVREPHMLVGCGCMKCQLERWKAAAVVAIDNQFNR